MLLDDDNTTAGTTGTAPEQPTNNDPAPTTEPNAEPNSQAEPTKDENVEKIFKQDEVNKVVSDRVNREKEQFCKKLGIEKYEELDSYVAKYAENESKLADLVVKNSELVQNYALLKNNIDENRVDDVKIYFKGKGIVLDDENLSKEIATHPEWVKKAVSTSTTAPTIQTISPQRGATVVETEEERKNREYGVIKL